MGWSNMGNLTHHNINNESHTYYILDLIFFLLDILSPGARFIHKLLMQVKFKISVFHLESMFPVEISCTKFSSCPIFLHKILELSFYILISVDTYVFYLMFVINQFPRNCNQMTVPPSLPSSYQKFIVFSLDFWFLFLLQDIFQSFGNLQKMGFLLQKAVLTLNSLFYNRNAFYFSPKIPPPDLCQTAHLPVGKCFVGRQS